MTVYDIIRRPIVTEKTQNKKDDERTLCFEVHSEANKSQIKQAVETIFKVKVADIRTVNLLGKLRRRGKFAGYKQDWKKAYVKLKAGQKSPEYAEV
jgi:large subunit ribosomal protein L23